LRRLILLFVLLGVIVAGWLLLRKSSSDSQTGAADRPTIEKRPINFASRTFDPENPSNDMPQMHAGELAVCDSNFMSSAVVTGEALRTDSTHAIVSVTHVKVSLQLNITIWLPINPTQHVAEHEQGHREISEVFYHTADKLAEKIAATYIGKKVAVTGIDLNAEINKALEQMGADITEEYDKELNPGPTQLRYDDITDHSRSEIEAKDAVAQALKEDPPAVISPAASPRN
jgi:hypothetical protein